MDFNYLRNRIRENDTISIIRSCIEILRLSENPNKRNIPIYGVLHLVELALLHGGEKYPSKIADGQKTGWLLDLVLKFQNKNNPFLNKDKVDPNKIVSLLAYQQSFHQLPIWKDSFARQIQLYTKLKSTFSIENLFLEYTGIKLDNFIILSLFIWVYTNPNEMQLGNPYSGIIRDDFFNLAGQFVEKEDVKKFIDLLTIKFDDAREFISKNNKIRSNELKLFEIPIFAKYPILEINSNRFLLHKNLLKYTFNYFIYDYLKHHENEKFTKEFGARIEKYVKLGLEEISIDFKTENELIKILPNQSKVVDFMIEKDILVECKAIDIKPYPNVFPANEILFNWLKDSIIKAYSQQMMTVANTINPEIIKYGIVITYKETYFGNGNDAWEQFLESPTKDFALKKNLNISVLPPQHLFFIDISSWDRVLMIIKEGKATLKEILLKVIEDTKIEKRQLFSFHLNEYDIGPVNLTYLNEAYKLFDFLNEKQ